MLMCCFYFFCQKTTRYILFYLKYLFLKFEKLLPLKILSLKREKIIIVFLEKHRYAFPKTSLCFYKNIMMFLDGFIVLIVSVL